jgi:hypothetical protein
MFCSKCGTAKTGNRCLSCKPKETSDSKKKSLTIPLPSNGKAVVWISVSLVLVAWLTFTALTLQGQAKESGEKADKLSAEASLTIGNSSDLSKQAGEEFERYGNCPYGNIAYFTEHPYCTRIFESWTSLKAEAADLYELGQKQSAQVIEIRKETSELESQMFLFYGLAGLVAVASPLGYFLTTKARNKKAKSK